MQSPFDLIGGRKAGLVILYYVVTILNDVLQFGHLRPETIQGLLYAALGGGIVIAGEDGTKAIAAAIGTKKNATS